jgi:tRNA dimethylallyltransferase
VEVARGLNAEILSVDSMQVYRGMDIGTAKPTVVERRGVPHHMIDRVDPEEEFSVADFRREARAVIDARPDTRFLITGGSGLHLRAVVDPMSFAPTDPGLREELEGLDLDVLRGELEGADTTAGEHVDLANPRRLVRAVEILRLTGETPSERAASAEAEDLRRYRSDLEFSAVGIDPGERLDERVEMRLKQMRAGGLVEEVVGLRGRLGRTARSALGYREIAEALGEGGDLDQAFALTARNTKRLAKKQRTWFQRDPRIRWIPWLETPEQRVSRVQEVFDESD